MNTFQHQLWGYALDIPDHWKHRRFRDKDGFAPDPEAFQPGYDGEQLAQLLIKGEWNSLGKPIQQLWEQHLGQTSLLLGAKKLGSAPWKMAGAVGFETEIVLPKKSRKRLWAGILAREQLVLEFLVLHWKDHQESIEPQMSQALSSLRLVSRIDQVQKTPEGLPLPGGAEEVDPRQVVDDIDDQAQWRAYQGTFPPGSLQAFYIRELPHYGWVLNRYVPYPNDVGVPFARLNIAREENRGVLGLLPGSRDDQQESIVLKTISLPQK